MLKRLGAVLALLAALVLGFGSSAMAANPHFVRAGATGPDAVGALTVNFKIAGLGANEEIVVTASADATAVYACQNRGGNFPSDPKKTEATGPVGASGEFPSGKNGQVTGSLTITPPASTLSCPPGQNRVLVSVSYTNVEVSAPGAGSRSIGGTYSATYYMI